MSSSPCRLKLKCIAAWKVVAFQFWAAYLAPRMCVRRHYTAVAGLARYHPNGSASYHTRCSLSLPRPHFAEIVH